MSQVLPNPFDITVQPQFYHATYRKIIVVFGQLFAGIKYFDGHGKLITVPLRYAPQQTFLASIERMPDDRGARIDGTLPQMAFEDVSLNFAPERMANPNIKIETVNTKDNAKVSMGRVPYDIQFNLYYAVKNNEDGLKIFEQIVPFFNPYLNITINDIEEHNIKTDIQFVLNSPSFEKGLDGDTAERRYITYTLNFTAKCYFYCPIRDLTQIKRVITNFTNIDYDQLWARLTTEVVPFEAMRDDPHEIKETWEENTSARILT